ncbi:MAG: hypothetical protein WCR30_02730 [Clostridia bacterium]
MNNEKESYETVDAEHFFKEFKSNPDCRIFVYAILTSDGQKIRGLQLKGINDLTQKTVFCKLGNNAKKFFDCVPDSYFINEKSLIHDFIDEKIFSIQSVLKNISSAPFFDQGINMLHEWQKIKESKISSNLNQDDKNKIDAHEKPLW